MPKHVLRYAADPLEEPDGHPRTQAERILAKFGGAPELHRLLLQLGTPISIPTLHRWMYPKARNGRNGLIPGPQVEKIRRAARFAGIVLTDADWSPEIK